MGFGGEAALEGSRAELLPRRWPGSARARASGSHAWWCWCCGAVKALDAGFVALNERKIVLPRFDVRLMPLSRPPLHLEKRSLLRYSKPPQIIFTGDSRTMDSFDPEVIAKVCGVEPERFFNFATGSQGISFARDALVPSPRTDGARPAIYRLRGNAGLAHQSPEYSGLGPTISPSTIPRSLAYRLAHPEPGDAVEGVLAAFLARHVALYRYRSDLVAFEIVPSLKCLFLSDCYVRWAETEPDPFQAARVSRRRSDPLRLRTVGLQQPDRGVLRQAAF